MNSLKHMLINGIFAALISKIFLGFIDMKFFVIVVAVGALVDIDHLFQAMHDGMIKHPAKLIRFWAQSVNKHISHFYLFHTYEVVLLLVLLGIIFNDLLFLFIALGILLHLIGDAITNTNFMHGLGWIPHYSIICILFFGKR